VLSYDIILCVGTGVSRVMLVIHMCVYIMMYIEHLLKIICATRTCTDFSPSKRQANAQSMEIIEETSIFFGGRGKGRWAIFVKIQ